MKNAVDGIFGTFKTKEIQGLAGPANLAMLSLIDHGAFGTVWRGTYNGKYVAIKKISFSEQNKYQLAQMFLKEAETMLLMKHERIVKFIDLDSATFSLILELMPLGSLSSYISRNKKMPWSDRYQIMADISEGMAFLHSDTKDDGNAKQELFHQDMKSGNVLLTVSDNKLRGKISDFGLAFLREMTTGDASSNVKLNGGTKSYQAPELFTRNAKFSKKADVFAAGIVFLEIVAQRGPIDLMVFYQFLNH